MRVSSMVAVRWLLALSVVGISASVATAEDAPGYNERIRPILAENCFQCHGPDSAARKADLRLDKREAAIEAGAFAPGKPGESELISRIFSQDPKEVMPPPATKKNLTAEQKELLKKWVATGAEYQSHWSLIAPKRPDLPPVQNQTWARTPIDRFILAQLEKHGLQPGAEADKRTLARRLALDLTGLPPKPEQVEAFVNDNAPEAYEKLVDQFLAMPQWGEHRGRYWLDAARYADTHGIHFDNFREMWTYRNWVIGAFNRNMPFDQFTIEQLAGDLLPDRTLDQQIASGFNRCNITTNEGGAINEEYLVLYNRDRTETTAQVWLGLTAGCAVCHDHKFDPITQREFYEFAAFFNNSTQNAMDGNIKDTPPIMVVPSEEDRPVYESLSAELPIARGQLESRKQAARPDFDRWLASPDPAQIVSQIPQAGLRLHLPLADGVSASGVTATIDGQTQTLPAPPATAWEPGYVGPSSFKAQPEALIAVENAGRFETDQTYSAAAWVKLGQGNQTGAVLARMDDQHDYRGWDLWIEGGKVGAHIVHKWPNEALKVLSKEPVKGDQWNHLLVTYDGSGKTAGVKVYVNGVVQQLDVKADKLKDTIQTDVPLKIGRRNRESQLNNALIADVRVYDRSLAAEEAESLFRGTRISYLVNKADRTPAETDDLYAWWLGRFDQPSIELTAKVRDVGQKLIDLKNRGTIAHVMQERGEPASAFILFRGDYDKRRDQVSPKTPAFLPAYADDLPKNRLGFAKWLLQADQPLTSRVTVNRFWQELFGAGLVRTTGDFGVSGELPSHPELLDWLAVEFRESGWDMKRVFKLMVMSSAYRQAATVTPEKLEKDRANRLLSRGPRFRMDAEMVRDYALATSGLLVSKIGGPSVRPYQPEGVWEAVAMPGSNTRDYQRDKGDGLYRRSLYTFWKRAAPPASLDIFNAPNREVCTVRRERTNTPLQALVTLNDIQYVEAARALATQALKAGGSEQTQRLDFLARHLLSRPLRADESPIAEQSLRDLLDYYHQHEDAAKELLKVGDSPADATVEPRELAAWTMLTNEFMNLDEVLNK